MVAPRSRLRPSRRRILPNAREGERRQHLAPGPACAAVFRRDPMNCHRPGAPFSIHGVALACVISLLPSAIAQDSAPAKPLPFPGLLKKAEREAGNPLATYAAMLEMESQYRASKPFAGIYDEVRL